MRSLEQISEEINYATSITDVVRLKTLVSELREHEGEISAAIADEAEGFVLKVHGDDSGALQRLQSALNRYQALGIRGGIASVTGSIGLLHLNNGEFPEALMVLARAQELHLENGDKLAAARDVGNMGIAHYGVADYPKALDCFTRSLSMSEELDDKPNMAVTTGNIGNVHHETGDYQQAVEYHMRALALHEELGSKVNVSRVLPSIGVGYAHQGQLEKALEMFERALILSNETGDKASILRTRLYIIQVLTDKNMNAEALEKITAIDPNEISDPGVKSFYYKLYAQISEQMLEFDVAKEQLKLALQIALEFNARNEATDVYKSLRDLAIKQNDLPGYVENNTEYQRLQEEVRGREATQKLTMIQAEQRIEAERRERDKERALLYGTLPKIIADRILRGEDVTGDHHDSATVMFLDIVDFTTLSATLTGQQVTSLLDALFKICDGACSNGGTTRIKTIGDSYLAVAFPAGR